MGQHRVAETRSAEAAARQRTSATSTSSDQKGIHPIIKLQRTIGNRAVQRLIQAQRSSRELTGEQQVYGAPPVAPFIDSAPCATGTVQRQAFSDDEDQIGMDMGPAVAAETGGDLSAASAGAGGDLAASAAGGGGGEGGGLLGDISGLVSQAAGALPPGVVQAGQGFLGGMTNLLGNLPPSVGGLYENPYLM